ncbi:hypothetical protein L204_100998 [Cryptococcus depauperatus]|nr:hypothetical protein L204_01072 [Cryptococcus depauperatus CBS 7855]
MAHADGQTLPSSQTLNLPGASAHTSSGQSEDQRRSAKGKEPEKLEIEGSLRSKSDHASSRAASTRSDVVHSKASRKVRTRPPYACFEPPTPPEPNSSHDPVPSATTIGSSTAETLRRLKRYPSYSSSSDMDSSYTSDEEPPWWIFTQRGMARIRQKRLRYHKEKDAEATQAETESAREDEDKKKRRSSYFSSSRRSSRDKDGTPSSSRIFSYYPHRSHHPPLRLSNTQFFRRPPKTSSDIPVAKRPRIKRVDSAPAAPSSPIATTDLPIPNMSAPADGLDMPQSSGGNYNTPVTSDEPIIFRRSNRRQLTAPAFSKLFKPRDTPSHEGIEPVTDSEVPPPKLPSQPSLTMFSSPQHPRMMASNISTPDGSPSRPRYRRKASHRLRLNIPPPISQHFVNSFAHGWPHAGTWQDALYGYYEEPVHMEKPTRRRARKNRSSTDTSIMAQPEELLPSPAHEADIESSGEQSKPQKFVNSKRLRNKRQKRIEALLPPTPSGLGFTSRISQDGELSEYPWENIQQGQSQGKMVQTPARADGGSNWTGDENGVRSRMQGERVFNSDTKETIITKPINDESQGGVGAVTVFDSGKQWGFFQQKKNNKRPDLNLSWKKRAKRMLFLDVRVTIWIRVLNLIIVVVALGLAITIRLDLIHLHLPGVIGSSTTLIISYSSTTILHVLTAIYREYFGKPIGLWGLRSKMLWVCLDLLFVALWSSAMSLAINDLIVTPLECSVSSAWWRANLEDDYALLLQGLRDSVKTLSDAASDSIDTIGVSGVSHSLGITLPESVIASSMAREVCRRQVTCIALSLVALLLYGINMVLSLFRIFETVRRTANVGKGAFV